MGDYADDFYDDDRDDEDATWCDRCQGSGIAECYCGGDQCYCENAGEMECPQCDGQGSYVPTAKQIAFEAEMRRVLSEALASVDTRPKDEDATQIAASLASGAVPNEDSADAQPLDSDGHSS